MIPGLIWVAAIGVGMLVATMFPGLMGSILGTLITLGMAVFFGPVSKLMMSVMETAGEILGGAMSGDKE
jgi:carbon monoxide dehydrogenase subunit G